jgi:hypothetical protein
MNVRVVPEGEGARAEKVERQLAADKQSQSTTRVVVKRYDTFGVLTTDRFISVSFAQATQEPDFASLAAQYRTFKVSGIKFDIKDINPSLAAQNLFGTYHDPEAPTTPTVSSLVDQPDTKVISGGTGQLSLYWYPSGPLENSWFSTQISPPEDFGGLHAYVAAGTAAALKYTCVTSYILDFRSRF